MRGIFAVQLLDQGFQAATQLLPFRRRLHTLLVVQKALEVIDLLCQLAAGLVAGAGSSRIAQQHHIGLPPVGLDIADHIRGLFHHLHTHHLSARDLHIVQGARNQLPDDEQQGNQGHQKHNGQLGTEAHLAHDPHAGVQKLHKAHNGRSLEILQLL